MVTQLRLGQYQLGDGIVFGTRTPFAVANDFLVQEFGVEQGEIQSYDTTFPQEDGTAFGIDTQGGMNLTWKINLWKKGKPALDDLALITREWNDRKKRTRSGEVTTLSMNKSGRQRLVYGRPRRFLPSYGAVERGWCPIDCDFKCSDSTFYDYEQSLHRLEMANPSTAGAVTPFKMPLRISQSAPSYGTFTIGGNKETWPVFIIEGPVINPTIELLGHWKFSLNISLNHTDRITIDSRPWYRMTLLNDEYSRPGRYTIDSITLPEMQLEPGQYNMTYTGLDQTLSSAVTIGWRNGYSTP